MNDQYEEGREVAGISVESGTVAVLNRSEIEQQVTTAHKFPRSIKRFRQEALQMVTLNESVAESCIYALPRGNKTIEGPSARFAEVVASAWGNCRAGARVVSDAGDFITAQGVFYDCERNVGLTYEVQRRITDSKGKRYNADMIGVTGNAASSMLCVTPFSREYRKRSGTICTRLPAPWSWVTSRPWPTAGPMP